LVCRIHMVGSFHFLVNAARDGVVHEGICAAAC
jgi:hypothetical protein